MTETTIAPDWFCNVFPAKRDAHCSTLISHPITGNLLVAAYEGPEMKDQQRVNLSVVDSNGKLVELSNQSLEDKSGNPLLLPTDKPSLFVLLYSLFTKPVGRNRWSDCRMMQRNIIWDGLNTVVIGDEKEIKEARGLLTRNAPFRQTDDLLYVPLYNEEHLHGSVWAYSLCNGRLIGEVKRLVGSKPEYIGCGPDVAGTDWIQPAIGSKNNLLFYIGRRVGEGGWEPLQMAGYNGHSFNWNWNAPTNIVSGFNDPLFLGNRKDGRCCLTLHTRGEFTPRKEVSIAWPNAAGLPGHILKRHYPSWCWSPNTSKLLISYSESRYDTREVSRDKSIIVVQLDTAQIKSLIGE